MMIETGMSIDGGERRRHRRAALAMLLGALGLALSGAQKARADLKVVKPPPLDASKAKNGAPTTLQQANTQALSAACTLLDQYFGASCLTYGGLASVEAELSWKFSDPSNPVEPHAVAVWSAAGGGPGGDPHAEVMVEGTSIKIDFRIPTDHPIGPEDWSTMSGTWSYEEDRCFHDPGLFCLPDLGAGRAATVGDASRASSVPAPPQDRALPQAPSAPSASAAPPDCETNPYQSGCDLPPATTSLSDMLKLAPPVSGPFDTGAAASSGGGGGGARDVTHDGVEGQISWISDGISDEWDESEGVW